MAEPKLLKELHFWDVLALMLGVTIGAGIFAVPGRIAQYFPSFQAIAIAWIAAAAFYFIGTLVYSELGARLPHTGGEYVYIHKAFGPLPAFIYGWAQLLIVRTNPVAALSLVFAQYASSLVPMSDGGQHRLAAAMIVSLAAVNYCGLRPGKRVQVVTSIIKVGGLLTFAGVALFSLHNIGPNLASTHPINQQVGAVGGVATAMLLVMWAFVGWDRVGYVAGEMRNPQRDLPLGFACGALLIAFLYMSMNFTYHAALPISKVTGSKVVAADVARLLWGTTGVSLLALLVMVSTLGANNGNILASSRVYYKMANDGLFFRSLASVHPRWHSPHISILVHCGWALVLLFAAGTVENLVSSFVFIGQLFWGLCTIAFFKFRWQGGATPFKAPGYPVLPALYLTAIAAMTVATCYYSPRSALANLAILATAFPFYFFWQRRQRRLEAAAPSPTPALVED